MKTTKRALSFVLAAIMMVSMLAGMQLTVGAANSSALDPVIIDLSSKAVARELINVNYSEKDAAAITGNFYYDDAEGALSISKTTGDTWAGNMKFTFSFNEKNAIEGRPYMIVKYKTNIKVTDGGTALIVNNYNINADSVTLEKDVAYSGGEYVYTKPANIKNDSLGLHNNNPRCFYTRWMDKWHNVIALNTNQADAKFFIKEIAFFATAEEAAEYYIRKPLIIDMSSEAAAKAHLNFDPSKDYVTGTYSFDSAEGAFAYGCTASDTWASTRLKFGFRLNTVHKDWIEGNKYMVVTYKTNLSGKAFTFINFQEPSVAANNVTLTHDVMFSGGEYVRTEPSNINVLGTNKDHYARLLNGETGCLYVNDIGDANAFSGKYFYIKEIAFFESPEQAYDYYGIEPLVVDMSSKETAQEYLGLHDYNSTTDQHAMLKGNYTFDSEENAFAFRYDDRYNNGNGWEGTHLRFQIQMKKLGMLYGHKYMVVTYRTNLNGKELVFGNFNATNKAEWNLRLASNVGVSGGEYIQTEPVLINNSALDSGKDHYARLRNKGSTCIYVKGVSTPADFEDKYFYVKEIAFFTSPEQAYEYYDIQPVVIDMSTRASTEEYLTLHDYNSTTDQTAVLKGNYKFIPDEEALSVTYVDKDVSSPEWNSFRLRFHIMMDKLGALYGHKYMVVTYNTNLKGTQMIFGNFNATNNASYNLILESDMGVSNGKYVRTEPVLISNTALDSSKDHYARIRNKGSTVIYVKGVATPADFENKYLYIKEIAFFTSPEQAAAYYSAIDAEQPGESGRINTGVLMMLLLKAKAQAGGAAGKQVDAFVIDLSDKMTAEDIITVKTGDSWDHGKYDFSNGGVNFGYSTDSGSNAEYNKLHVKFRINLKNANTLPADKKFMVVTYKTNIDTKVALKFNNMWAFAQPNFTLTLEDNISASRGEWKRTSPINVDNGNTGNSNHFTRFNNPQLGNLFYLDGDISEAYYADKYFTIKEIAFFNSESDAKAYYRGK